MAIDSDVPAKMPDSGMEPIVADCCSSVQSFYTGASVLVTGGTGFLGKVLIEKLLWACPDVSAIYVLVRDKKGLTGQQRIDKMLGSKCFDRLRESRGPGFGSKLVPVQGDIAEDRLGLSDLDLDLLSRHVSIVFHVAATIRFNEPLHVAVTQNVRGTRELLALCRTCPGLKAVVHVSTTFSHCPLLDIEERFYHAPMDCDLAIKMADEGELTPAVADNLVSAWPNTYSFTKALAEEVVRRHGHGLPVCVFRPAIVIPAFREPVEGWVDSMAGPASLLAGYLTGFIRVFLGDARVDGALVPCDMVVDGMIAAAWDVAQKGPNGVIPVFNYAPSATNPVTWQDYLVKYRSHMGDMPSSRAIWTPGCVLCPSRTALVFVRLLLHTLPAWIADVALMMTNRKPCVSRFYSKIDKIATGNGYFSTRQWNFQEKNVPALWDKLGPQDKAVFNFDMRTLDWDKYFRTTSPGIRKFILKEDPSTISAGRERYKRILQAKMIFRTLVYMLVMYIFVSIVIGSDLFGDRSRNVVTSTTKGSDSAERETDNWYFVNSSLLGRLQTT